MGAEEQSLPTRFPSLDGWRAVSILLVLSTHSVYAAGFPNGAAPFINVLFHGILGVRFFFVISGFLITYLLLKEYIETGSISLRRFYARRALRILPVYFAFLGVLFALQIFTPFGQRRVTWIANVTFTSNYFPRTWTTGHLWSLAVEEQFYLLWPAVLCLVSAQNTRRIIDFLFIPIIVGPICRIVFDSDALSRAPWAIPIFAGSSALSNFDSISFGCLSAVFWMKHQTRMREAFTRFAGLIPAVGLVLVIVPEVLIKLSVGERLTIPFGNTLQALGFSLLLLQSIFTPQFFKPLNWAIVRRIGILSYSIYIWHMIFCTKPQLFGLKHAWFLSFYGFWPAVLLIATCSYYFFEKPLMNLRARLGSTYIASGKSNFRPLGKGTTPALSTEN